MSNMVLAYMDSRSFAGPELNSEFVWNVSMFETLLAPPAGVTATGAFFDGVLLMGNTWFNHTAFAPDPSHNYTTQSDWEGLLDLLLSMGAAQLDLAAASTNTRPKFVLSIPTPDPRAVRWGRAASGQILNLSVEADRVAAATWYIGTAMQKVAALKLRHVDFAGFYWFNERVVPADYSLVQAVAAHVHGITVSSSSSSSSSSSNNGSSKLIFMWIPYFESTGWQHWQELGFDFATLQPNWAFHSHRIDNHTLTEAELFARVANDTKCRGMGIEMELPLAVRNPQIKNESWRASFNAYVSASRKYNWGNQTIRTYYYGNDYVSMAQKDPAYFKKLYHAVAGWPPNHPVLLG
jgi:hypothetical protein